MRRSQHLLIISREMVSPFTFAMIIKSEKRDNLRDALRKLLCNVQYLGDRHFTIRTDPAPGFLALVNDPVLSQQNIVTEIGNAKNPNKNPVAAAT